MEREDKSIQSMILKLEREQRTWYPWHCSKKVCADHMCKTRNEKIEEIRTTLLALKRYLIIK
jgi:hypothetical protein